MKTTLAPTLIALVATLAACSSSEPPAPPAAGPAAATRAPAEPAPPPQAWPREAVVKSLAPDATEIRYRVYGSGEPAIVFVHGWSCDSGYWDGQLNHFAAQATVITVDLAGHGKSPGSERQDWGMANFGADVAAAVKDAGAQRVILVGSSMGGPVALEAARLLPGRVIGIVGVDTFREIAAPFPQERFAAILGKMRADFAATTAAYVGDQFFTDRTDPVLKQWIVDDMASAPPEVAIPAVIALMGMDYRAALDALDLPIVALNSTGSPTDEAAIRALEPRFRLVTLDGVGHFPMLEDPKTFNRALERIVSRWMELEATANPLPKASPTG